jgi:glycosyltransferase involved in cell wall biosynthesis
MKILHFILGKANPNRTNGVNQVINGLAKYLSLAGNKIFVVGLSHTNSGGCEIFKRDGFEVEVYPSFFNQGFKRLKELAQEVNIVHLHGVWNNYNYIFAKYLQKHNIPYVVTVHAGLSEDRLKQSNYYFKKIYHVLFQKHLFNKASGIQALSYEETYEISKHTSNGNIFFVNNGIDLMKNNYFYQMKNNSKIKIGYLGRISVEKNIENLILAIYKLPDNIKKQIELFLIGPKNKNTKILQGLVVKLKLQSNIFFTGALYGKDKDEKLKELDFYVHPALSDVISIAVMEIMSKGIPCVITRTSHVSYYDKYGAFIMVEPTASDIKRGIITMIENKNNWGFFSIQSRKLTEKIFNWKYVANKLLENYQHIVENGK